MINDKFIDLIRIAEDDEFIRATLLSLLKLAQPVRIVAIDKLLAQMENKGAPSELIEAITPLREDNIAQKTFELLNSEREC